ncbi:MAG: hypothetical protein EXS10_03755 [Phycisphaerales bacterium]|nr:hypothetical protein [Phycisphaerales bacterium]
MLITSLVSLSCCVFPQVAALPEVAVPPAVAAPVAVVVAVPPPSAYPTDAATLARLEKLALENPTWIKKTDFGKSATGTALTAWSIAKPDAGVRPTLLIVAGVDGVHLFSTQCAVAAAEAALAGDRSVLEHASLLVIPVLNPDARAVAFATHAPRATTTEAIDDDRDGVTDEEAPQDVNGDGIVSMMRLKARVGRTPTHLIDTVDPRIVRAADATKREHATHELFIEGLDSDRDGRIAEDAIGGTDLDRNFSHRWPEFASDAGAYPLSAAESLAFAEFVALHPEITSALIFGVADTLAEFPDSKDKDASGSTPSIYHADDHAMYREMAKAWKDASKCEKAIDIAHGDLSGSIVLWLANHRGIAAVTTSAFARPDAPKPAEGAPAVVATGDADQQAWLEYSDRVFGGAGFVAWQPFEHPTLGAVEIGGWRPFFKEQPSAENAATIATAQGEGAKAMLALLPRLEIESLTTTPLASGLIKVELVLANTGALPTTTKMDTMARARPPIVVRVNLAPERFLDGKPVERIDRIAAGATARLSCTLLGTPGEQAVLRIDAPGFPTMTRDILFPRSTGATR